MNDPNLGMISTDQRKPRGVSSSIRCGAIFFLAFRIATTTFAATVEYGLGFVANQSLWQGGPSAGFRSTGQFGSSVGIRYLAQANSGTVAVHVEGRLRIQHPEELNANSAAMIEVSFLGNSNGGVINSNLGASVDVTGFIPCVATNPFTGHCLHTRTFDLLDEGFFLNPSRSFTPSMDSVASATDIDNAIGVGPNLNLIIGELGAEVNVDMRQSISFAPTGITGAVRYQHRTNGTSGMLPFTIPTTASIPLNTLALSAGMWDFEILSVGLQNSFRNDIDLDLRPAINYVIGSWPPPGSPLFRVSLIDETFALNFNTLSAVGSFSVNVRFTTDFNGDGLNNLADINLLLTEGPVASGVPVTHGVNNQFDLTGNGLIDNDDVNLWLADAAVYNGYASPYKRGDANLDGFVDGSDFSQWNSNRFTSSLLWNEGDFTGDGVVDGSDFSAWNSAKFTSSDETTLVPEPRAMAQLVLAGISMFIRSRQPKS